MDTKKLSKMSLKELDKIILDLRKELFALRFQLASGQLQKTHLIKRTRRLIAMAITIKNEKRETNKT